MKLYHASMDLDIVEEFSPRVPSRDNRLYNEDYKTPRICVSSSIQGTLSAAPWGGGNLIERIHIVDETKLIRIYEFDTNMLEPSDIIGPEYLYKTDSVRDAVITGEHWILKPIKPTKTYLIKLLHYSDEYCEDEISYENAKKIENEKLEGRDIEQYIEGVFTVILLEKYEVVPEEKRSKIVRFDNEIIFDVGGNGHRVTGDLLETFDYSTTSYLYVESIDGKDYLKGALDTRFNEFDLSNIDNVINSIIDNAKVIF